jgi:uncharacterized membrane protein YjjP (DUF1212 family)
MSGSGLPTPTRQLVIDLLRVAGRLLLQYSESTGAIHRTLTTTARALTHEACQVLVSYRGVAIWVAGEGPALEPVNELRYNMLLLARVHTILEEVRRGELEPAVALARLTTAETDTPRHSHWLAALALGMAGASLAALLGADGGASGVAGAASALGLLARHELGRRQRSLLALPLTATLLGAVLGGLAIRLGWTQSPGLVLIVPALMLVPGPHLINGLADLIDNYVPMSLARLGLATGILLASGLGVILGIELTLIEPVVSGSSGAHHLGLFLDMFLAGIVACGFAVFYNTGWAQLLMTIAGGMAGHGLRYLALDAGCSLAVATFLGGVAVGIASAWLARFAKSPVAVIAFAGAVTMMPGLSMYRALAGGLLLARHPNAADPTIAAATMASACEACLVVGGLTLGLIVGTRIALALMDRVTSPAARK